MRACFHYARNKVVSCKMNVNRHAKTINCSPLITMEHTKCFQTVKRLRSSLSQKRGVSCRCHHTDVHNRSLHNSRSSLKIALAEHRVLSSACSTSHCARVVKCKSRDRGEEVKNTEVDAEEKEDKIDFKGLKQLISMGLGTMSGDITEINLNDPQRTVVMELEANNFEA